MKSIEVRSDSKGECRLCIDDPGASSHIPVYAGQSMKLTSEWTLEIRRKLTGVGATLQDIAKITSALRCPSGS
ncbi:MAG: hypothetical protein AB1Z98_27495 [Nannocystaceae bacterium]